MLLSLRGIKKAFDDRDILTGIDLDINERERVGIVGDNGAGKTTLMNIIAGDMQTDEGAIIKGRQELKIGYLLQSTAFSVNTFNDMINTGERDNSRGEFTGLAGQLGLRQVQHWCEDRIGGLSGGEKTKLALADILAVRPDLLLLDEPTNHLDFQGVDWLADELGKYRGTILVISHDRYFLDRVANRIIEIEAGKAVCYYGNYTFYRNEKARMFEAQLHQYYEQEKAKERIRQEIERLKIWSAKAHREAGKKGKMADVRMGLKEFYRTAAKKMDKRVKSRIKQLERIDTGGVEKPREEARLNFMFEDASKHGKRILEAKEISKSFGERALFRDCSFFIKRGEKVGVLGPNGCGKTTLVKAIMGEETLDSGEIWLSPSASISYISQDVADLNSDWTPLRYLTRGDAALVHEARTVLACMGIVGSMLDKPVGVLSLGERTRIKVAGAILDGSDFLILDEPTNHLDLHSREQLEDALEEYEGTILVVSHDRYMLEKVCSKMLVFQDEKLVKTEGGFKEYMESIQKRKACSQSADRIKEALPQKACGKEERMVIENQLAAVLSSLCRLSKDDPGYAELDREYVELLKRRKEFC